MREGSAGGRRPDTSRCRTSPEASPPYRCRRQRPRARHRADLLGGVAEAGAQLDGGELARRSADAAADRRGDSAGERTRSRRPDAAAGSPAYEPALDAAPGAPALARGAPAHAPRGAAAAARRCSRPIRPSRDAVLASEAVEPPPAAAPEATARSTSIDLTPVIAVLELRASDLHLTSGCPPGAADQRRAHAARGPADPDAAGHPARALRGADPEQREKFEENLELDFAYSVPGRARFRVNIYRQRDSLGAAFRIIPFEIRKLEDLGVPPSVANFARRRAASCSSPGRPARASRRRSPR